MGGRDNWPSLSQNGGSINEQGTFLLVNTRKCLEKVRNKEKPSQEIIEAWLHAYVSYLEQTKNQPTHGEVMDAIDKMSSKLSRGQDKTEEGIAAIKSSINEANTRNVTAPNKAGKSWASVAATPAPISPKPAANKETEIIVRLNDKDKKQEMKQLEVNRIAADINTAIASKEITNKNIRAVKKLPSGDLAIHTVNAAEADKLRENSGWTAVLGARAKAMIHTYAVMVSGVRIKDFDLFTAGGRDIAMRSIREANSDVEELKNMEIMYISWRTKPTEAASHHTMVIEVSTPEMGNAMLDNCIVVGGELRTCSVFNKACRTIQCFKCYHYGHTTTQCSREERCGYCAGPHSTRSEACEAGHKTKCCVCDGAHNPWRKECPEKRKEIERIRYQQSITPARFAVQRQQYTITDKTVDCSQPTEDMAIDDRALDRINQGVTAERAAYTKRRKTAKHDLLPVESTYEIAATPLSSQFIMYSPDSQLSSNRRTSRSTSPVKRSQPRGKAVEEAEIGGTYSNANRTPLAEINNNRTRSHTRERRC